MKKTILNLGAIMIAFFIGVAINNACAGSIDNMSDSELRSLVSQLQKEVNSLKDRVAELENKIGNNSGRGNSSSSAVGEFEVNGMHFHRSGNNSDPIDYYEYGDCYYITKDGERQDLIADATYRYTYDSYGRISSIIIESSSSIQETNYSYSNRTITHRMKVVYKDINSPNSEYYTTMIYHLK